MTSTHGYRANIEAAMKKTPRFLFRFWHARSGGDNRLNTINAITPAAFLGLDASNQPSFFEMPRDLVGHLAERHVAMDRSMSFRTVYSSWSQSLAFVLSWAWTYRSDSSVHISILDTSKLPSSNVVLHTSFMSELLNPWIRDLKVEYLAYGTVESPTFMSIPLMRLATYNIQDYTGSFLQYRNCAFYNDKHPFADNDQHGTDSNIETAIEIGNLYGPQFALPFSAHLLTVWCQDQQFRNRVILKLASMHSSTGWASDPTILSLNGVFTNISWESKVAGELIKEVVEVKYQLTESLQASREQRNLKIDSVFGDDLKHNPRQKTRSRTEQEARWPGRWQRRLS